MSNQNVDIVQLEFLAIKELKSEKQYDFLQRLGSGYSGFVYKAKNQEGKDCALKIFIKKALYSDLHLFEYFKRELNNLKALSNDHIIKVYESGETTNFMYMSLEYCNSGTLTQLVKQSQYGLNEETVIDYLQQMLEGYRELHEHKIIHRDIKPDNIFIQVTDKQQKILKFGDFGFSKSLVNYSDKHQSYIGTLNYAAPEILQNLAYDGQKVDMYSLGVLLYFMLFKRNPFINMNEVKNNNDALEKINQLQGHLDFFRDDKTTISIELQGIINQMVVPNPKNRLSWNQLYRAQIIKKKFDENNPQYIKTIDNIYSLQNQNQYKIFKNYLIIPNQFKNNESDDNITLNLALDDLQKELVVIKQISIEQVEQEYLDQFHFLSDLQIYQGTVNNNSKYLLRQLDYFPKKQFSYASDSINESSEDHRFLYQINEFCNLGSLDKVLAKEKFNEDQIAQYFVQILYGLQYLHSHGFIHRNLHESHILFHKKDANSKIIIKLSGFLQLKKVTQNFGRSNSYIYMNDEVKPPEFIEKNAFDYQSQIYQLGLILYKVCFGGDFNQYIPKDKYLKELDKIANTQNVKYSSDLLDLIKKMLQLDPLERITWFELHSHPFFIYHQFIQDPDFLQCLQYYLQKAHIFKPVGWNNRRPCQISLSSQYANIWVINQIPLLFEQMDKNFQVKNKQSLNDQNRKTLPSKRLVEQQWNSIKDKIESQDQKIYINTDRIQKIPSAILSNYQTKKNISQLQEAIDHKQLDFFNIADKSKEVEQIQIDSKLVEQVIQINKYFSIVYINRSDFQQAQSIVIQLQMHDKLLQLINKFLENQQISEQQKSQIITEFNELNKRFLYGSSEEL